jgi:hypothetical protein
MENRDKTHLKFERLEESLPVTINEELRAQKREEKDELRTSSINNKQKCKNCWMKQSRTPHEFHLFSAISGARIFCFFNFVCRISGRFNTIESQ